MHVSAKLLFVQFGYLDVRLVLHPSQTCCTLPCPALMFDFRCSFVSVFDFLLLTQYNMLTACKATARHIEYSLQDP